MGTIIAPVSSLFGTGCLSILIVFCALVAARNLRTIMHILGLKGTEEWKIRE